MHLRINRCVAIVTMASAALLSACSSLPHNNESTNNPDLRTVKENYPGNEYKGGKFSGPFRTIKSGSSSLWRYFTWKLNPANPRGTKETKSDLPVVLKWHEYPR